MVCISKLKKEIIVGATILLIIFSELLFLLDRYD